MATEDIHIGTQASDIAQKPSTGIEVLYRWNGKHEPERLNRVFDMLFAKCSKFQKENGQQRSNNK